MTSNAISFLSDVSPCTPKRQWILRTPISTNRTGDRFIPNRLTEDVEFSRFQLHTPAKVGPNRETEVASSSNCKQGNSAMRERLLELKGRSSGNKLLSFKTPCKHSKRGTKSDGEYEYWSPYVNRSPSVSTKKNRKAPKSADKVLDAPNLINDFYLNVLDWSKMDMLSIALESSVYIFNAQGEIHQLCNFETDQYITSLKWNQSGKYLAVGLSNAEIQLWDVNIRKCIRQMHSHETRVSSLSWNSKFSLLSSGSQSGNVHNYDIRKANFHVHSLSGHSLDVCGLQWSPNGRFLASGGNDNLINIWDTYHHDPWSNPSHTFKSHTAAVKALAWCPWQSSSLASGGGSADKTICLWNACNGELQSTTTTDSQVSGLVWSARHKELLSCHGNPSNALRIWKWQSNNSHLQQFCDLHGHEGRILHVALGPDGQTVATAGADETLRFWKCFEDNKNMQIQPKNLIKNLNISTYIR